MRCDLDCVFEASREACPNVGRICVAGDRWYSDNAEASCRLTVVKVIFAAESVDE